MDYRFWRGVAGSGGRINQSDRESALPIVTDFDDQCLPTRWTRHKHLRPWGWVRVGATFKPRCAATAVRALNIPSPEFQDVRPMSSHSRWLKTQESLPRWHHLRRHRPTRIHSLAHRLLSSTMRPPHPKLRHTRLELQASEPKHAYIHSPNPERFARADHRAGLEATTHPPSNRLRCSFHSAGNGFINRVRVSAGGWRPSRMASTMSGASRVRRRMRLT